MGFNVPLKTLPQNASIIHRWRMEEASGTRSDSVGTCHLTDNNTVLSSLVRMEGNRSADFELANSEYLSANSTDSADMNFTSENFSISFLVNFESLSTQQHFVNRGEGNVDGYYFYTTSADILTLTVNQAGANQTVAAKSGLLTTGTWTHLVAVRDGATGYIYVNRTDETSASDTLINPVTATRTLYIGRYEIAANYLDGLMDDIIVWSGVALSASEVGYLYNLYKTKGFPTLTSRTSPIYKQLE